MPRLYLDTVVLITAFEKGDGALQSLLLDGDSAELEFATCELTLAELLVLHLREKNERLIEFYKGLFEGGDIIQPLPIDQSMLYFAAVLRANNAWLKLPDAIHLSAALGCEATHFVSYDKKLERISTISHSRWGVFKSALMPQFINPRQYDVSRFLDGEG